MNRKEIERQVAEIKALSGDNEGAHSNDDKLRRDFIQHIAESSVKPYSDWAKLILKTDNFGFHRYCA